MWVQRVAGACGLNEGAIGLAQNGPVGKVLGLLVGLQATDHHLARCGVRGRKTACHQPLDFGVEHGLSAHVHRQPVVLVGAGDAVAIVGMGDGAGVDQAALGQDQGHVHAGHAVGEAQIAAVHVQADRPTGRLHGGIDHHGAAGAPDVDRQVAGGGDRPRNGDRSPHGGHRSRAAGLLQAVDQQGTGFHQPDVAPARVAHIQRGHVDFDRVEQ